MRSVAGLILVFLLAASLTGIVVERGGHGAHQFDLGPAPETVNQVKAVGLDAAGGIRTARRYPKFTAVYVTRTPEGVFAIFPNTTPIAGCLLVWRPSTERTPPAFVDPCAGGQWDLRGRYVSGPEPQNLLQIPATVSDAGRLIIDTLDVAAGASPAGEPAAAPPETTSQPLEDVPQSEWALIPTVAHPPRSEGSWLAGWLITLGREWGISATDAAVLLISLGMMVGAAGAAGASVLRARARRAPGSPEVYLEWRDGRRWSRYPEPPLILAPGSKRNVRVRLANKGSQAADAVSVLLEAPRPLQLDLEAGTGIVAHSILPGGIHVRWEFERRLRPGGRSRAATLRLARSAYGEVRGLTRVVVVSCGTGAGDPETATHVVVQLV